MSNYLDVLESQIANDTTTMLAQKALLRQEPPRLPNEGIMDYGRRVAPMQSQIQEAKFNIKSAKSKMSRAVRRN